MDLDTRMKKYEESVGSHLVIRCPAILRIDGRAFHTFTRGMHRPWDQRLIDLMQETTLALCDDISTAKFAYSQSDEISILLTDYDTFQTEQWFGGKVQKIASIAASIATATFNRGIDNLIVGMFDANSTNELWHSKRGNAMFDARVFSIPVDDVVNYFLWRQQDATRNSISMLGRSKFSHKELHGKNCYQIQEMLWQNFAINWNDCPAYQKRGWCVYKQKSNSELSRPQWQVDLDPPVFSQDRGYIERWLETKVEEMV